MPVRLNRFTVKLKGCLIKRMNKNSSLKILGIQKSITLVTELQNHFWIINAN